MATWLPGSWFSQASLWCRLIFTMCKVFAISFKSEIGFLGAEQPAFKRRGGSLGVGGLVPQGGWRRANEVGLAHCML